MIVISMLKWENWLKTTDRRQEVKEPAVKAIKPHCPLEAVEVFI